MTQNDMRLHHQWATRPDDQRFLTLEDLARSVRSRRQICYEAIISEPEIALVGEDLQVQTTRGPAELTHWSFGQLARLAGAPADYLRTLPPVLAAPNLQWSLERRKDRGDNVKLLATRDDNGQIEARAFTSESYGRIWDIEVVQALQRLGSDWHVPAASYSSTNPKRATTLYASDRDVFVFLCRDEAIEIGGGQAVHRGVMAWNSEVGASKMGMCTFTYDKVCDNRIIWGVSDKVEISIRHTKGAPDRMVREVRPLLAAYAAESTQHVTDTIKAAQRIEVGKDRESVVAWMAARGFTKSQASAAYAAAEQDSLRQGLNPRSVWGLVQGATDEAHDIAHTDTRVSMERAAGALLDAVAA